MNVYEIKKPEPTHQDLQAFVYRHYGLGWSMSEVSRQAKFTFGFKSKYAAEDFVRVALYERHMREQNARKQYSITKTLPQDMGR